MQIVFQMGVLFFEFLKENEYRFRRQKFKKEKI